MTKVQVNDQWHEFQDAWLVIVGYAFGTRPTNWKHGSRPIPAEVERCRASWAYRTYDCIPQSPGCDLSGIDLFIADGINGGLGQTALSSMLAVAEEVSRALCRITPLVRFWELERDQIDQRKADGDVSEAMDDAWAALTGAHDLGVARVYKTLHH